MSEANLCKKLVRFETENGRNIELEAVYEDSLSSGSPLGTVVGFHGSPGSHNDFKYIRNRLDELNIRFIGVNYPGFTFTDGYSSQQHTNIERQNYSNALLDKLGIPGKIAYIGHSRGCENALETAVGRSGHGLVMINPIGLRIHRGINPISRMEAISWMYEMLPTFAGNAMMLGLYKMVGFKIQTGEEAINSMRSMCRVSLGGQLEFIEKTNEMDIKKLIVFAGKDHLNFENKKIPEEDQLKIMDAFSRKGASVYVANDTHFQNKSQAVLVADACRAMFENGKTTKNKL
ncbi:Protein CBG21859 [Caenorhabditis briggsae]|uniref:Protein CBG21859 n=1 Tax=Caenorhabditis briggsae TaxID=6238 RepID=A8Y101_CAEBR|nr:Protein CBG21859 [Caenorhabditis briggsae]CAP38570.2 Protein CBG21859 [Caenorhabditis briggsae]